MTYWTSPELSRPAQGPARLAGGGRPDRPPRSDRPDRADRAARRSIRLLGTGLAVLALGAVVYVTVQDLRARAPLGPGASASGPASTTPDDAARVASGIGPPPGTDVGAYIAARRQALATASGTRVAVVSLNRYATEASARALVAPGEVLALLAAAPGGQPAVVTTDLATWVTSQTAEARAERDEIRRLIPTVDDRTFKSFYQAEVERLDQVIATIRSGGDLAFAVVVRADVAALRAMEAKPEVRLVDAGPSSEPRSPSAYRGLRPEEASRANEPDTRPL